MNLQEIASASAMLKQELAPLADKIGQGAEYAFSLFVKQIYVNAFSNVLWIVPGIILLRFSPKIWKMAGEQQARSSYSNYEFTYFGAILAFAIGLLAILLPISILIGAIINPEFQAIKLIIDTFKTTTQ